MERTQFTFYESFYKAAQRLRATGTRCRFYDIICQYALFECVPELDKLPDSVALAFELVRPHLDTSRRRAAAGQKGGLGFCPEESNPEANGISVQANRKQSRSKKEREIEIRIK